MKIGLCGTVSVGKTTLINALAELPEFKDYKIATERSKYLRDLGIPLNTDSTLKGQTIFLAERVSELFHDNLLTDRTIVDVMAFTRLANSIDSHDKEFFGNYAARFLREYDYIFYIHPKGLPIEDNGVREIDPKYREEIDHQIRDILNLHKYNIQNLYTLSGSTDERVRKLLKVVFS